MSSVISSTDMTLAGVRAQYRAGKTPYELMAELRDKASQFEHHNVWIHLLSDKEVQPFIDSLKHLDPETSALWGIPFVLKDNIDLVDIPTTAGCKTFAYTPDTSAFVVKQLLEAGALPVGKANLDQFATGLNGTRSPAGACGNAFDPTLISGGSSSGSAVSVALGLATFSLGTDTAGSGRIPACFNNLVGVKPSCGLLSASGVVPACRSLDCVSVFALHTDDANVILDVAEGFDASDGYSRKSPYSNSARHYGQHSGVLTLGVLAASQLKFFGDEAYRVAYEETVARLIADGIELIEIDYTPFDEVAKLLYEGPWVAERYLATLPLIEEQPDEIFPVVREIIAQGGAPSAANLFKAQYRLKELTLQCAAQLEGLDALMTPTAGRLFTVAEMLAEPVRHNSELGYYMNFMNLLDMAAVSVPTAFTNNGRPFGVTLGAAAFSDRHLLSVANRIQQLCRLTMATTDIPCPALSTQAVAQCSYMDLVVCGAHLRGMPLNWQLTERGGKFVEATKTAGNYRLYALQEESVSRPALVRVGDGGAAIEVEVWRLPSAELGGFLQGIAAPLGLGRVTLQNGTHNCGFIAEACASEDAVDITEYGGWCAYIANAS